jgi:hypothetical protein
VVKNVLPFLQNVFRNSRGKTEGLINELGLSKEEVEWLVR